MKIYFIELRSSKTGVAAQYFNSLMLPILAVWSERQGWEPKVSFSKFSKVDYDVDCDVVALSIYTHLAHEGYEVARKFREMGKIVIIGGPHSKGCSDELKDHADLVFDRCNEEVWIETLKSIEAGDVKANAVAGEFVPADEMVNIPAYPEIEPWYGKGKVPLLLSSLGCPHDCDFCTDWNSKYVKRSVPDVIYDIKHMKSNFFIFSDPNFGANHKFTSDLLREMIPLKKKYMMETSLAWLEKDKYLTLLRDSGCVGIEVGLESLTTNYKKNVLKQDESILEATIRKIDKIKKYIPSIQVNIVMGLDEDNDETFDLVAELYRRSTTDVMALFVATPFPGTPYFDRMKESGRIFEKNWKHFNCCDLTSTMTNFELPHFCDQMIKLNKRIHSPLLILKKIYRHFVQYRDIKMTAIVALVMVSKCFNAFFFTIPELYKAKLRTAEHFPESELQTEDL